MTDWAWKIIIITASHQLPAHAPLVPLSRMTMNTTDDDTFLSKTKRKQAMEALQSLGEALVALSTEQLKRIDIPDNLRDAVREAQRMPGQTEALRRQMQYIGKLMRGVEPEPIQEALDVVRGTAAAETARLHRLEALRDQLLADEKTLTEIANLFPLADMQHLRSLRRAALKENASGKPPRSYRVIFQTLKELDAQSGSAPQ